MGTLKVNTGAMSSCVTQFSALSRELDAIHREVSSIRLRLGLNISTKPRIAASLIATSQAIERERDVSRAMREALIETIGLYQQTERRNAGNAGGSGSNSGGGGGYHVDSIVFDDEGGYGGDQGHMESVYYWNPFKCWDVLHDLRLYYPNMSIFEAFKYVSALNSVGCGYVALANTIFLEYEGRPEAFERTFGFPMYKDGDLNYDRMILDIYATTDKANINDGANGYPQGATESTYPEVLDNYLNSKGVTGYMKTYANVTPENYRTVVENGGKVILGYRGGNMYDEHGNAHAISAHAITVTGVTDDGRYIVSSWGKKYYINASDLNENDTFFVTYYNS